MFEGLIDTLHLPWKPTSETLTRKETKAKREEAARKAYAQQELWRVQRRTLLLGLAAGAGISASVSVGLWAFLTKNSVEDFVSEARKLENSYRALNLDDTSVRNRYTQLIASIFSQYYPSDYSPNALVLATNFVDTHDQFVDLYTGLHMVNPILSTKNDAQALQTIYGFTKDGKVFFDSSYAGFHSVQAIVSQGKPIVWNPLRSLRMGESHEYVHVVVKSRTDDAILKAIYPSDEIPGKYVEGFKIRDLHSPWVDLWDLDEAAVELLAIKMNNAMFGSWYSNYILHGRDITLVTRNLDIVLKAANISPQDLAEYHRHSWLDGLLVSMAKQTGMVQSTDNFEQSLQSGLAITAAIVGNDEKFLRRLIKNSNNSR